MYQPRSGPVFKCADANLLDLLSAKRMARRCHAQLARAGWGETPCAQWRRLKGQFPAADIATGWGMTEDPTPLASAWSARNYKQAPRCPLARRAPAAAKTSGLRIQGQRCGPQANWANYRQSPAKHAVLSEQSRSHERDDAGLVGAQPRDRGSSTPKGYITILGPQKNILFALVKTLPVLTWKSCTPTPDVIEACAVFCPDRGWAKSVGASVQTRDGKPLTQAIWQRTSTGGC